LGTITDDRKTRKGTVFDATSIGRDTVGLEGELFMKYRRRMVLARPLLWGLVVLFCPGCSLLTPKNEPSVDIQTLSAGPLTPEQTEELLNRTGENWLYGQGFGETAVNAATAITFPPYAIYLLGNGLLNLSGYEPFEITAALPEEPRAMWGSAFEAVTSIPGNAAASLAGREFIDREEGVLRLKEVLATPPAQGLPTGDIRAQD
jgi:hypothetical protein